MSKINNWMIRKAAAWKSREEGQGLAEYGLILALVAVLCVAALGVLQGSISGTLNSVASNM
ncbi:MAG: Flp family type IVb pilin [Dehalococcoidia bacterium]|nr:Flp family type IVb pilin [Dehalococcoidia bacterium]